MTLDEKHPELAMELQKGNFIVHKSTSVFSGLAVDQAHEQNNTIIKGGRGTTGFSEDPKALCRCMVAGPELSCLVHWYGAMPGEKDAAIFYQALLNRLCVLRSPSLIKWKHFCWMGWVTLSKKSLAVFCYSTQRMMLIKFLQRWLLLITREERNNFSHSWLTLRIKKELKNCQQF